MTLLTYRNGARLAGLAVAAFMFFTVPVRAQVVPTGTFGSQPTFTFGGTGIPNDAVMTNSNADALGVTLGLSATQRFTNPALTNDGAGTFFATPGLDLTPGADGNYAMWNFDYFVGGDNASLYHYELFYDFDPASGNNLASLGQADPGFFSNPIGILLGGEGPIYPTQDSWNLGMDFLATFGFVLPPSYEPFDPNALGEYSFALIAYDANNTEVARSAIEVSTGAGSTSSVTPEPATMSMMAFGLVGMAGMASRRRRKV